MNKKRRYEIIADKVSALIAEGSLLPGDKLPSVRRLSSREKASVTTVLHAYELLENKGIVVARPQSGYYVKRPPQAPPSPRVVRLPATPSYVNIEDTVAEILRGIRRENIIPFGAALPDISLLPGAALNKITAALSRRSDMAPLKYEPPQGHFELRRQLSRYAADWGCRLAPHDFIVTSGCTEALSISLRASVRPGGVVAVESPAYYGALMIISGLGLKALEISTHPEEGVDLDELERFFKKGTIDACLFAPNFYNPLCGLPSDEHKEKLANLLARYNKPLIEDDIYGDLSFDGGRPRTVKSFDQKGLVMLCSSFTKTIAPGYRLGYAAPGKFREAFERIKFMSTGSTNTLSQMAIADFLARGGYDRHIAKYRQALGAQVATAQELVGRHFPPATRVSRPKGGMVLWVEFTPGFNAYRLYQRALEKNISLIPGHIFSNHGKYRNCVRISCGAPWTPKNRAAFKELGEIAASCLEDE